MDGDLEALPPVSAEEQLDEGNLRRVNLNPAEIGASEQLYYILLLLVRQEPLTIGS